MFHGCVANTQAAKPKTSRLSRLSVTKISGISLRRPLHIIWSRIGPAPEYPHNFGQYSGTNGNLDVKTCCFWKLPKATLSMLPVISQSASTSREERAHFFGGCHSSWLRERAWSAWKDQVVLWKKKKHHLQTLFLLKPKALHIYLDIYVDIYLSIYVDSLEGLWHLETLTHRENLHRTGNPTANSPIQRYKSYLDSWNHMKSKMLNVQIQHILGFNPRSGIGGFLKWRIPLWMVYMEDPYLNGWWLGVTPFMETRN